MYNLHTTSASRLTLCRANASCAFRPLFSVCTLAGEGKDWVREDGFTVEKYKEFWQTEMKDEDEAIAAWGDKLPQEAWEHLPKKLVKEIESKIVIVEEDEEEVAEAAVPVRVSAKKKKTSPNANANSTKKKTNKNKRKVSNDGYDSDGLGEDIEETRDELFSLLESGRAKINAPEVNKTKSFAKAKERASAVQAMFVNNVGKSAEAMKYKKIKLDPVAKRVLAQIDEHVAGLAANLRNEMIGNCCLTNYKFCDEEEDDQLEAFCKDIGEDTEEKVSDDDDVATEEDKSSDEKDTDKGGDKVSDEE